MGEVPVAGRDVFEHVFVDAFLEHHDRVSGLVVAGEAAHSAATAAAELEFSAGADGGEGVLAILRKSAGERLDLEVVLLGSGVQAVHVELVVAVDDVAVVELVRLDAVAHHVSVRAFHGRPEEVGFTEIVGVADGLEVGDLRGLHLVGGAEDAEILDGEEGVVVGRDVGDLDVTGLHRLFELVVVMLELEVVLGLVDDRGPAGAVGGDFDLVALVTGFGAGRADITMPLSFATVGEHYLIKKISGKEEVRRFLENLGFVAGTDVSVVSEISGNVIVMVRDCRVAISREMAQKIII